jgi:hypothetical protein
MNMKANSLKITAAVVVSFFWLGTALHGQMSGRDATDSRTTHPVMTATAITQADAEKKYPAAKGGQYPRGNRSPHDPSGVVSSPYPPYQQYDCSKVVAHGGLVLDVRAKKVFVYP